MYKLLNCICKIHLMFKRLSFLICVFICSVAFGQTFTYSTTAVIPDDSSEVCYPIAVSGIVNPISMTYGLTTVCINLSHSWDDDLQITLKGPNNQVIDLSSRNGGAGDNYSNTCFNMGAVNYITSGVPPFTGTYFPEQSLNGFNNGSVNPNGTWYLCIRDIFPLADQGTIYNWSITFGANPVGDPPPPPAPCGMSSPGTCLCPDGTTNCDLLPDMTASALIIQSQHTEYPGYMTISNATPNIGWGPMEVHGVNTCFCDTVQVPCSTTSCPDGSYPKQQVVQTIYHRNGNSMTSYNRPAGTMSYHPSHGHTHIDNWAEFTLRVQTSNPNPLMWPIVGRGAKISFCLINLGDCTNAYGYCVDSTGATITMADIPNSGFGLVDGCGIDQGIYTGNLDIYDESLPGMELTFPGICNGNYYLISITDPENNFLETKENNNWVAVPMTLTEQATPTGVSSFTYLASGNQVSFTNTTPVSSGFYWDFGDGTSDTVANPVHVYTTTGSYTAKLVILNQCYSPTTQVIGVTDARLTETQVFNTTVYPNPAKDEVTARFYITKETDVEFRIVDLTGKEVFNHTARGENGWNKIQLRIPSELAAGTYMLSVKAGVNHNFTRLIIGR
jgi:subtilisin-like proprotein convertase family protein